MILRWTCLLSAAAGVFSSNLPDNQFQTLTYGTIVEQLHDLGDNYPHLVKVFSAQERYQLPSPGACSEDGSVECEQWVLHISEHATLESDPERPEVFFSGCLHGDEQVGPTAVMETAKLMVYAAVCHADPAAKECDDEVLRAEPESVPWLARLALTRSTVIMPMTNSIGYYQMARKENGLDPNRDFPYHQWQDKCMTTITARAVNEVWREHIFQLAVTFHGGMVGMAYEWGSPEHPHRKDESGNWKDVSPDDIAQKELTDGLSLFAGGFVEQGKTFEPYPVGRMNELVYPVSGGMEDWAYAGSWGDARGVCKPTANGGYPEEKTIYDSATLRAFNILVEASDNKHPPQSLLGSRQGLLESVPSSEEHANGHVSRNIRLSLMVVDLVEPYVQWAPFVLEKEGEGGTTGEVVVEKERGLDLEWSVGGAFEVDSTQLIWGPWPEKAGTLTRRDWENLVSSAGVENRSPAQSGRSRWERVVQDGEYGRDDKASPPTTFRATFYPVEFPAAVDIRVGKANDAADVPPSEPASTAFVVAVATVDQAWGKQPVQAWPDVGPQSHLVNARTSESWYQESQEHVVRGRLRWLSVPLKVVPATEATAGTATTASAAATATNILARKENPSTAASASRTAGSEIQVNFEGDSNGEDANQPDQALPKYQRMPSGPSHHRGPMNTPTLGVLVVMMICVGAVVFGTRAREFRFGIGGGGSTPDSLRDRPRGVYSDPGCRESGGIALGTSGDALSRRRTQETSSSWGGGHSGTSGQSRSLERKGLLSPVEEMP